MKRLFLFLSIAALFACTKKSNEPVIKVTEVLNVADDEMCRFITGPGVPCMRAPQHSQCTLLGCFPGPPTICGKKMPCATHAKGVD